MIKIEDVERLSTNSRLLAFSSFILSNIEAKKIPDYALINLMKIPRLVPHVFVIDVLNSPGKLRLKYCGTEIDNFYGTNMSGKCVYDYYKGEETFDDIESIYREGIQAKKPAYTRRRIHLENETTDKYKIAETIMFPCSSGEGIVNYTVGFADYYYIDDWAEKLTTLIEQA